MTYTPLKNKLAQRLAFVNIICGLVLFALTSVTEYRLLGQVIGVCAIVAGIQFLVRFVLSDYRYILEYTDVGGCDLIVCRRTGRNDVKVCHLSMGNVTEVVRRGQKKVKAEKVFNYCQNFGEKGTSVIYDDGGRVCEIILEADDAFTDTLRAHVNSDGGNLSFAM